MWYHDHTLGMTRSNVYAGPAGFYLLRGGPGDKVTGVLPGPAPALGDPAGLKYYEIPIAIQDRSFNADGSLFYPDNRAFFEELNQPPTQPYLDIPFIPDQACDGRQSDISPIFNPEFFGNTMVVNGNTWPFLEVEQRRYRFRFLNGCNSRFLLLQLSNGLPFWQIGAEGGFLPTPVQLKRLLLGLAERADVIVDFTKIPAGTRIVLQNLGPDEPFGGGEPPATSM
jgi:bilirubin oxidase